MKVAIIGSEGYLGAWVVKLFQEWGHRITRVDAGMYDQPLDKDVVWVPRVPGGVAIRKLIQRVQPDWTIWLAALAHDPYNRIPSEKFLRWNTALPLSMYPYGSERFVFISSYSTFDAHPNAYAESKRAFEVKCRNRCSNDKVPDILRFGTLYGEPPDGREAQHRPHLLLNSMVMGAVQDGVILLGNPALMRPVLHVRRAAEHILNLVHAEAPPGQIINHHEVSDTLGNFAQRIQELMAARNKWVKIAATPVLDSRSYGAPPYLATYPRDYFDRRLDSLIAATYLHQERYQSLRISAMVNLYRNLRAEC